MKKIKSIIPAVLLGITFVFMVTMGAEISASAYAGVLLCLRVVIPSLFPFFVLCTYMNSVISQCKFKFLRYLGRLCHIPQGAESVILIGLLGGYPIGAQCVAQSFETKSISKDQAERMLGFCNNAGPAFIFGMLSTQFDSTYLLWLLWAVQIVSCILTGYLLPAENDFHCTNAVHHEQISVPKAFERSIKAITSVCGWVILFKIVTTILFKYLIHTETRILLPLSGILELVNGCADLVSVDSTGLRFILASSFLSFGGICVHMQTISVTQGLKKNMYIKGKILQTGISTTIAAIIQLIALSEENRYYPKILPICVLIAISFVFLFTFFRKSSRFSASSVIQ